jgi:hypothetical protein
MLKKRKERTSNKKGQTDTKRKKIAMPSRNKKEGFQFYFNIKRPC